ncbi:MAG: hypothetical protein KIT34_17725 [Cyanobacteria bacterium TGS_CYA1]|nr:hypothetical protein [Cyanobacteria bacterium TGS_CYA1]
MNQKILALLVLLAVLSPAAYGEQDGDVTIKRNPDGTIETYDSQDGPASSGEGQSRGPRPVHSYTKKTSDGIHFKRNPDGSIETWEDDEPMPRAHSGAGTSKAKKKSVAKNTAAKKTVVQNTSVKKKTK